MAEQDIKPDTKPQPTESEIALLERFGFKEHEVDELGMEVFGKTGYPKPVKRFKFVYSSYGGSVEEPYFWMIDSLRHDCGVPAIDKIVDVFAASEQSSFFGSGQQRLGLQQDKVSQFLQAVGKMVKELFQFVRELRIIDERLALYEDSYKSGSGTRESAEISLKGIWIDMVEGGSKNPGSVYGLAREVGFTILPDLFFSVHPKSISAIDETVDRLEFNRKVKEVLKRKLRTFMEWKEHTYKELTVRRKFTIQYFRQHYDIIRLYIDWTKPYLRNIKRLGFDIKKMDSADLITAFEGSMIEIEVLAKKNKPEFGKYHACVLMSFLYRTRPSMSYLQPDTYQRGPIHVGKVEVIMRAYAWDKGDIAKYINMRRAEEFEIITTLDESLKTAMDSLGDEMRKYLKEAGEEMFAKEEEKKKKRPEPSAAEPFLALIDGFKEMFGALGPGGLISFGSKAGPIEKRERDAAEKEARRMMWMIFKNYRKAHEMITPVD